MHALRKHGEFSLLEIYRMTPFEFEIHTLQVLKDIQEENARNN